MKAPGARGCPERWFEEFTDGFGGEDGISFRLVERDGERYLVYRSSCGVQDWYGVVNIYRIEGERMSLAWHWRYDAGDGEGLDDDETNHSDPNRLLDERAHSLYLAACEDPVALMTVGVL